MNIDNIFILDIQHNLRCTLEDYRGNNLPLRILIIDVWFLKFLAKQNWR